LGLAAELGDTEMFTFLVGFEKKTIWQFANIQACAFPLDEIDFFSRMKERKSKTVIELVTVADPIFLIFHPLLCFHLLIFSSSFFFFFFLPLVAKSGQTCPYYFTSSRISGLPGKMGNLWQKVHFFSFHSICLIH